MTKDTVIFGLVTGFIGNIAKEITVWPMYFLGYTKYTFAHIAAGAFVSKPFIHNPFSLATGFVCDWTMAGIFGIILLCLIRVTGHDYPVVKGTVFFIGVYLVFYGALMSLNFTRASLTTPLPNFVMILPHLAMGVVSGWYIGKYDRIRAR